MKNTFSDNKGRESLAQGMSGLCVKLIECPGLMLLFRIPLQVTHSK